MYKYAQKLHRKGQFKRSNKKLKGYYAPHRKKASKGVYNLMASNYKKMGRISKARDTYLLLIKFHYARQFKKHLRVAQKTSMEGFDAKVGPQLGSVYVRIGGLYLTQVHQKFSKGDDYAKEYRLSKRFFIWASRAPGRVGEKGEKGLSSLKRFDKKIEQREMTYQFGIRFGHMLWTDKFVLKDTVRDREQDFLGNSKATTMLLDIRYRNEMYYYGILIGGFQGVSTVGEKNNYFVKDATVLGGLLIPNIHTMSVYHGASFGVSTPIMIRSTDVNDSQTKEINPKSTTAVGLGIDGNWELENGFTLGMSTAWLSNTHSSTIRFEIGYLF
ncbi:hypothetical protein N9N67_02145 [Bacteriovoracaceae bacterium]|nr:hypothetical protein [Bacteriovoracaceae bacterium]